MSTDRPPQEPNELKEKQGKMEQQGQQEPPAGNPELVTSFAGLIRLAADQPTNLVDQRVRARDVIAVAAKGPVRLAPGHLGALLVDDTPLADAGDDARLLAARLLVYGIEEITITPHVALADLLDLARLLGAAPTGAHPEVQFAARAAVLDARALPRRLRPREGPSAPRPLGEPSSGPRPRPLPEPITAPRSQRTSRMSEPPSAEGPEKARVVIAIPESANERLRTLLAALNEATDIAALRAHLDDLVAFVDLAFRTGRPDDLIEALAGLVAIERLQLERDSADEHRQIFTASVRRVAKPVLVRQVATLRHQRVLDATATERLQAVLHRFGTDGADALIDEYSSAASAEARATCVEALRALRRTYDALFTLTRDPREAAVRQAVAILAALREPRAEELLLELLHHDEPRIRRAVIGALGHFGSDTALLALGVGTRDSSSSVRASAVAALAERRTPGAVPLLTPLLSAELDREVLYAAVAALGTLGGADAVQALIRCAEGNGEHPWRKSAAYRIHACTALAAIRTPAAMACVQGFRDDRDREVREASARLVAQAKRRSTSSVAVVSEP